MKVYIGTRTEHGAAVLVEEDGETRGLDPRHDLRDHSRDGFERGCPGGGSAQLALAMAADMLGDDDQALALHQRLKLKLVGALPDEGWVLTEGRLWAALHAIEQDQPRSR
jgi:hypothetical protein